MRGRDTDLNFPLSDYDNDPLLEVRRPRWGPAACAGGTWAPHPPWQPQYSGHPYAWHPWHMPGAAPEQVLHPCHHVVQELKALPKQAMIMALRKSVSNQEVRGAGRAGGLLPVGGAGPRPISRDARRKRAASPASALPPAHTSSHCCCWRLQNAAALQSLQTRLPVGLASLLTQLGGSALIHPQFHSSLAQFQQLQATGTGGWVIAAPGAGGGGGSCLLPADFWLLPCSKTALGAPGHQPASDY
jgi:hypothetical protein